MFSRLSILLVISFALFAIYSASVIKRSPNNGSKEEPECHGRLPCGWLVYNKSTRNTEFFMNNTCICSSEKHCSQTDDDLSVGAYVYRCLEKKESKSPNIS